MVFAAFAGSTQDGKSRSGKRDNNNIRFIGKPALIQRSFPLLLLIVFLRHTRQVQYVYLFFFILINGINLVNVRFFGESEFLFSCIKIVAILSMIGFGAYLLFSGSAGPQAGVANLWQHGGFFPHGIHGFVMALAVIMFAFGGLELIGIAAAETKKPETTIPKAVNQIVYRILIFYIGAIGSRKNNDARRKRLAEFDLSQEEIARLHGPVGLKIGSKTPPEIAVAILAEMTAVRHGVQIPELIEPPKVNVTPAVTP